MTTWLVTADQYGERDETTVEAADVAEALSTAAKILGLDGQDEGRVVITLEAS